VKQQIISIQLDAPCCWDVPSVGRESKRLGQSSNEELHVPRQALAAVNDIVILSTVASPLSGSLVEQLHVFRLFSTSTKCIASLSITLNELRDVSLEKSGCYSSKG
jgi:hypothetical protein